MQLIPEEKEEEGGGKRKKKRETKTRSHVLAFYMNTVQRKAAGHKDKGRTASRYSFGPPLVA